ncbi:MAG: serine hydrolase, partial [Ignavibacteriae bacterium]|nr:serine hydrolase [Ignavibacteriota bacterium]
TGLSWESLMRQRLFDPLDMSSAGFGEPDTGKSLGQPWGHNKSAEKWEPSKSYDAEAIGPAGEIHCSIEDWAKFLSLQLTVKNPILDSEYLSKLTEPVGFYAGGWGIIENLEWAKGKVLTHNGSNGIWYSTVLVAPKINRAYVVVTNSRDFSATGDICSDMLNKLIKMDLETTGD